MSDKAVRSRSRKPDDPPEPPAPIDYPAEILEALRHLAPPVRTVIVQSPNQSKNMLFLDLSKVCYITTKKDEDVDSGRDEMMFVTLGGERFYNNEEIGELEKKFATGNPWMMRTHNSYIVNLANLRGFRYSNERDLYFKTLEEPLINAVSLAYRDAFDTKMGL